jgi:hypothetical protein
MRCTLPACPQAYLDNIRAQGGQEALSQFLALEKELQPLQQVSLSRCWARKGQGQGLGTDPCQSGQVRLP